MGKDCHRADQTGHVRGNPSDDTLPELWSVADIFLPQEKGALVFAFSELLRRIHAEAVGPSARPTWEMCLVGAFTA